MKKRNQNCQKKLRETKAFTKVRNYFAELIDRKDFQDEVKKIRIKYKIPPKGFSKKEKHMSPEPPEYGPQYPKRWTGLIKEPIDQFFWERLFRDENRLSEKFQMPSSSLNIIDDYVLYNDTSMIDSDIPALCMVQDCHDLGEYKEIDKENETSFPVMIRINPYAGVRDILDYVKIAYSREIEPLLNKYKDKSSRMCKVRTKNEETRKRNDFIFKNRHKKLKEIRTLLRENNLEILDDGHIGKIIGLEKKRRKEV